LRGSKGHLIAAIVALALALVAGPGAASAAAEVLVDQPPGPSGVGVLSDETPSERSDALDDFYVPAGAHWQLEGIRVFGAAADRRPRTFVVKVYRGFGSSFAFTDSSDRLFSETVPAAGDGPSYLLPIQGAPLLDERIADHGQFWISVQALSGGGEDEWEWLTGPDTPGSAPAYPRQQEGAPEDAEPGLAFELLGTSEQILRVQVVDGYDSAGTIVSSPPGISCALICEGTFPRGTTVTLNPSPLLPSTRFTQWGFLSPGYTGASGALVRIQVPTPCAGTTPACAFTLAKDEQVEANFEPINEVDVLHVVRDRRHGRGELVVWVPGEGVLSTFSYGVKNQSTETVPAGLARIPLIPRTPVAKRLHRKGSARVSVAVEFRPINSIHPGTVRLQPTLLLKRARKPTRADH
jgi:hypothetical protein